uniref:FACT complex subunit SSRP1 n=1 Tax=Ditylenchus dipsaci TaxID=166011 RepID=A0A915EP54_9BILA
MHTHDYCHKGWNFGDTKFEEEEMIFEIDEQPVFKVPLASVTRCDVNDTEAVIEFDSNEDDAVQLSEMRFFIPNDPDKANEDVDIHDEFRKAVLKFAQVENESDQLCMLPQLPIITPRGRYDFKVYANLFSFHGKTYDFKVPFKTISRASCCRIRILATSQSRYQFLVLNFDKNDHIEVDMDLAEDQLKEQYNGKLDHTMKGPLYEVLAKLVRVLVDIKIIVPGKFIGESGTAALSCAFRQTMGFLYPLEKGFVYVHRPTIYIRYQDVQSVHFARSDISTRSFDFEVTQKSGHSFLFNSVGKEEYNKLFDFVREKGLPIRNANAMKKSTYTEGDTEELDAYKETLKHDAAQKDKAVDEMDSDSDDEDYDENKDKGGDESSSGSSEAESDGSA